MNIFIFLKRCLLYISNNCKIKIIHKNYKSVLTNLRKQFGKQKLKVCFLSSENSKWVYQSLYDKLYQSKIFEPYVLVTLNQHYNKDDLKKLENNYNFFRTKGINTKYAFDIKTKKHIPINMFNADIVFLEEPWDIADNQNVYNISKHSLCCYCSYGSGTTNGRNEYCSRVFKQVWKYFLDNNYVKDLLICHGVKPENLCVTGSIKLDAYKTPLNVKKQIWNTDNFRIIYAPHFSFSKDSVLKFGTFNKYYKFFLEYAKNHPEIEFIFKPHPNLKKEIITKNLLSENAAEEYYLMWTKLPNTHLYENGDYFDIFKSSDLMITDCNSFLTEYLPTLKPVLQLISKNSVGLNKFGEQLTKGYYKIHDLEELENTLDLIINKKSDPLFSTRQECLKQIIIPQEGVATKIFDYLIQELQVKL